MKKIYERPHIEVVRVKMENMMISPSTYRSERYDGTALKEGHELDGKVEEWNGGDVFTGFSKRGSMSAWE